MSALLSIAEDWREEADRLRERYGLTEMARLCEAHARELEEAIRTHFDELLTLKEAAEYTGYSPRTLRRHAEEGEIQNLGRKHAPRFRRADLQRKPGHLSDPGQTRQTTRTSPSQVVQRVLGQEDDNG